MSSIHKQAALISGDSGRDAGSPTERYFLRQWNFTSGVAAASHQLEVAAQLIALASLTAILMMLFDRLAVGGWGWRVLIFCLIAAVAAWGAYHWRQTPGMQRRISAVGIAVFLGTLFPISMIWIAIIAFAGALGAVYWWPQRIVLAREIDSRLNLPSTTATAVSLLSVNTRPRDAVADGFAQRLYQRAGDALQTIGPLKLLRPAELRRAWAMALLTLLAAVWCGILTKAAPVPGHTPNSVGAKIVGVQSTTTQGPTTQPMMKAAAAHGQNSAGLPHAPMQTQHPGHGQGARLTSNLAERLTKNSLIVQRMSRQLAKAAAKAGPEATLSRDQAARLAHQLQAIHPVGPERALASHLKHELAGSRHGHMGPTIQSIKTQLEKLMQINRAQMATLHLPDGGSRGGLPSPSQGTEAERKGKSPSGGNLGNSPPGSTRIRESRSFSGKLISIAGGQAGEKNHRENIASGVRVYMYRASGAAAGLPPTALLRAAARASAAESGYIPRRYRGMVRRYFSGR
ncbi:MAG: hypothetical protein ACP5O1_03895 [Phycisphaerae bacterium]